jgi:resuscitation-promoting factor RpfA
MPPRRFRGDHRKPSAFANTASAKLIATGVMGVGAAAASILAPTAAHAATEVQWDRVAQCESGGNWQANTGNGYFGGLQFSSSTWQSFDVNNYAARADEASREQQIDVANHVLARQGWSAWPVCSKNAGTAGTTDHDRAAHVRTAHQRAMAQKHEEAKKHDGAAKTAKTAKTPTHRNKATHHYVVRRGDTLASIARTHDVKGGWRALYAQNRTVVGSDPSHLRVGMRLAY